MTRLEIEGSQRSSRPLEDRLMVLAASLKETLLAVAREVTGPVLRPSRLSSKLSLDKSLASRLVRGLRSDAAFEVIHHLPSPTGLTMFLKAAASNGVNQELCERAARSVEAFQNLLQDVPGGRSALDALASDSAVEVRERAERTAKQGVFKSMSYLLGFHCETVTSALILQPSEDGQKVDAIDVSRRAGLRRLRASTPVAVFSLDLGSASPEGAAPHLESLEDRKARIEPRQFLVSRFCDPDPPSVEILQDGSHTIFALTDANASVHSPVTITTALMVRNALIRYRTSERADEGRRYLLHYPCKLLVRDLFIREDLYVGAEPRIVLEFPNPLFTSTTREGSLPQRLNTLDMSAPIEHLGTGLAKAEVRGVREHGRLLADVFDRSGWDPHRFRGYRTRIVYPVPMISMGWLIPLSWEQ